MYHVRNALRILLVLTVIVAASVATVSAAGYVVGSATKPVSVTNANPTTITSASSGINYAVGGTSVMALLQKVSKSNNLKLLWDDSFPAAAPWVGVNPAMMKGMSAADNNPANWGPYLAAQGAYDATTKTFNWNWGGGGIVPYFPVVAADVDCAVVGAPLDVLTPGVVVGNFFDKGVWVILGWWPAGDPVAVPPGVAPQDWMAVFVSTGKANLRLETTYPTAWFTAAAPGPFFPWYALNWADTGVPPAYQLNCLGWAPYVAPPADALLYVDTTKVKQRHNFAAVQQGTNYVYVTSDDGTGAAPLIIASKIKTLKATVKKGVTTTVKTTLK